jgi:hypothetical protein
MADGRTRYADDATIQHIIKLEAKIAEQAAEIKRLRDVLDRAYATLTVGLYADTVRDTIAAIAEAMTESTTNATNCGRFYEIEEQEGRDRSTPYLVQMTADDLGVEHMDVLDALIGEEEANDN